MRMHQPVQPVQPACIQWKALREYAFWLCSGWTHRAQTSIGHKRKTTQFCQTAAAILTERVEVTMQPTDRAEFAWKCDPRSTNPCSSPCFGQPWSYCNMCEGGCVLLAAICSVRTRVITHRVSSDHQDDDNDDDVRPTRPSSGQTLALIAMVNSMSARNARRVDRVRKHL
jgi:hypothetical protein